MMGALVRVYMITVKIVFDLNMLCCSLFLPNRAGTQVGHFPGFMVADQVISRGMSNKTVTQLECQM